MYEPRARVAFVPLDSTFLGIPRALLANALIRDGLWKGKGRIVLRVDDTDVVRARPDRVPEILEGLRWLGIRWDEGGDLGGPYAPYRQTERLPSYRAAVVRLLEQGDAYPCFCEGDASSHGCISTCRERGPLGAEAQRFSQSTAIRFKVRHRTEAFNDLLRGWITRDVSEIPDPVIQRRNGTPTFHLATVVDEMAFGITHIIRGSDHVDGAFLQRQLTEALGGTPVSYLHFNIWVQPEGNLYNLPMADTWSLENVRYQGFLPGAVVEFLLQSVCGQGAGPTRELQRYDDFLARFSLHSLQKANSAFDPVQLVAINRKWLRGIGEAEFLAEAAAHFAFIGQPEGDPALLLQLKRHVATLSELQARISAMVDRSGSASARIAAGVVDRTRLLQALQYALDPPEPWTRESLEIRLGPVMEAYGRKQVLSTIRQILVGSEHVGDILDLATALGRDTVTARLANLIDWMNCNVRGTSAR